MNEESNSPPKIRLMLGTPKNRQRFTFSLPKEDAALLAMAAEHLRDNFSSGPGRERSIDEFMKLIIRKAAVEVARAYLRQDIFHFAIDVELHRKTDDEDSEDCDLESWLKTKKKSAFMDFESRRGNALN